MFNNETLITELKEDLERLSLKLTLLESLSNKQKMVKERCYHYRNNFKSDCVLTVVVKSCPDYKGDFMLGLALCSPDDQFSRKEGVRVAKCTMFRVRSINNLMALSKDDFLSSILHYTNTNRYLQPVGQGTKRLEDIKKCILKYEKAANKS